MDEQNDTVYGSSATTSESGASAPTWSEEALAARVAGIIGPSSAATMAILSLHARRAAGQTNIGIYRRGHFWVVGAPDAGDAKLSSTLGTTN